MVAEIGNLIFSAPNAKGKAVTKMWPGRGQCGNHVVSFHTEKPRLWKSLAVSYMRQGVKTTVQWEGWGFFCRQSANWSLDKWVKGSVDQWGFSYRQSILPVILDQKKDRVLV